MRLEIFQEFEVGKGNAFRQDPKYQYEKVWLIFDIKADGRQKDRLVLTGHMTEARNVDIYSLHMKQESSQILVLIAAANSMMTLIGDVENVYLCAKTQEKIWTHSDKIFHQMGYAKKGAAMKLVKA